MFLHIYLNTMMTRLNIFILIIAIFALLCGCGSSVDSDAKNAAEMMRKSLDFSTEYELEKANEYFQQYKEIEKKYLNTDKHKEFTEAYWKYFTGNVAESGQEKS